MAGLGRCATVIAGLALALGVAIIGAAQAIPRDPPRLILTGVPPFGPTAWTDERGEVVPAGCGPEAARMLLAYYDRRFGYTRLVRGDPEGAIRELHTRMGTITVTWGGERQGLTWPWAFAEGLRAFVQSRYPGGITLGTFSGTLAQVCARSVELLSHLKPHVILFDWAGSGGIFPNHYAVVVGYDVSGERRHLVINSGWGYDFQILDMADPAVAPAILLWIEAIHDPPDGEGGGAIGPPCARGMWVTGEDGQVQLRPVLRLHSAPASTVRWPIADRTEFLFPGSDIAISRWDRG